ncbi:unnamed protein product, partial [Closterium sp. NIES-54]
TYPLPRTPRDLPSPPPTPRPPSHHRHISYSPPFAPFVWIVLAVPFVGVSTFLLWTSIQLMHAFECDCQHLAVAQHELSTARVEAEAASHAKGDFLTTVSHEIRTPMNGVIGMLNLLLETPLDGTQQDYAETACSSGRALCALINDILDLSKIEAEKLRLERIPLNLRAELDDVLALFVETAQEKCCVELAAFVANDVPETLLGDPLRVNQFSCPPLLVDVCSLSENGWGGRAEEEEQRHQGWQRRWQKQQEEEEEEEEGNGEGEEEGEEEEEEGEEVDGEGGLQQQVHYKSLSKRGIKRVCSGGEAARQ